MIRQKKKKKKKKDGLGIKFGSIVVTLTDIETRRREKSFLVSWFNIKLLPFSLQILRISILLLHGRNFNPWSVITNCTRLFRPPLAFHLFSSSFLRFFSLRGILSASIVRRLLRFFPLLGIGFQVSIFEFSSNRVLWRWIG